MKSFPRFPRGLGGLALLIARLAGAALGALCLDQPSQLQPWIWAVIVTLAVALTLGLSTRIAAAGMAVVVALTAVRSGGAFGWALGLNAAHVATLVLAGAGAYSLDARLFGRRVIKVRPSS